MKKSLLILTALCTVGCDGFTERQVIANLDPICLRGVVYYFFDSTSKSAMSPAYNQDGTLILCINDEEMKQEKTQ